MAVIEYGISYILHPNIWMYWTFILKLIYFLWFILSWREFYNLITDDVVALFISIMEKTFRRSKLVLIWLHMRKITKYVVSILYNLRPLALNYHMEPVVVAYLIICLSISIGPPSFSWIFQIISNKNDLQLICITRYKTMIHFWY